MISFLVSAPAREPATDRSFIRSGISRPRARAGGFLRQILPEVRGLVAPRPRGRLAGDPGESFPKGSVRAGSGDDVGVPGARGRTAPVSRLTLVPLTAVRWVRPDVRKSSSSPGSRPDVSPTTSPGSSPAGSSARTACDASRSPRRRSAASACPADTAETAVGGPRVRRTATVRPERPETASVPCAVTRWPGSTASQPRAGARTTRRPDPIQRRPATIEVIASAVTITRGAAPGRLLRRGRGSAVRVISTVAAAPEAAATCSGWPATACACAVAPTPTAPAAAPAASSAASTAVGAPLRSPARHRRIPATPATVNAVPVARAPTPHPRTTAPIATSHAAIAAGIRRASTGGWSSSASSSAGSAPPAFSPVCALTPSPRRGASRSGPPRCR